MRLLEVGPPVSEKKVRLLMARQRVWDSQDWYEIWCADRESMIFTMVRNLASDLDAGYNYFGNCITRQREMIEAFQREYEETLDSFKMMTDAQIIRWCYFDLKKRGAIS